MRTAGEQDDGGGTGDQRPLRRLPFEAPAVPTRYQRADAEDTVMRHARSTGGAPS